VEYSAEDISPVKKKVVITTGPQEVEAAILGTVALYKTSVQVDGFRKGKAPASVIEQRFHDKIYEEARQDLINVHINDVMQQLGVAPLSGINVDAPQSFERGKDYVYSIEFETLPAFDLPPYEGLEVEQEKVQVDPKEVEDVLDHLRRERAQLVPVEGAGPAVDGQVASLNFAAYAEDGTPVEGIKAENFDLAIGEGQALEDFEALVKTVPYGQEGQGQIHFPDDFLAKDLAGKTVTMKVKVHAIKERKLPELNDDFAKSLGKDTVAALREAITDSYARSRTSLSKSAAQKSLLDSMLKMVTFELPPSLVETQMPPCWGILPPGWSARGAACRPGQELGRAAQGAAAEAEGLTRAECCCFPSPKRKGLR
jgi:trigger factor